jgi:hypothetical protein
MSDEIKTLYEAMFKDAVDTHITERLIMFRENIPAISQSNEEHVFEKLTEQVIHASVKRLEKLKIEFFKAQYYVNPTPFMRDLYDMIEIIHSQLRDELHRLWKNQGFKE